MSEKLIRTEFAEVRAQKSCPCYRYRPLVAMEAMNTGQAVFLQITCSKKIVTVFFLMKPQSQENVSNTSLNVKKGAKMTHATLLCLVKMDNRTLIFSVTVGQADSGPKDSGCNHT